MKLSDRLKECGTVEVKAGPLFMLIGAAMNSEHGPRIADILEMLDVEQESADVSAGT